MELMSFRCPEETDFGQKVPTNLQKGKGRPRSLCHRGSYMYWTPFLIGAGLFLADVWICGGEYAKDQMNSRTTWRHEHGIVCFRIKHTKYYYYYYYYYLRSFTSILDPIMISWSYHMCNLQEGTFFSDIQKMALLVIWEEKSDSCWDEKTEIQFQRVKCL